MAPPRHSSPRLFLAVCCLASSIALAHPNTSPRARSSVMWAEGVRSGSGGGAGGGARGFDWLEYLKNFLARQAAMVAKGFR